MASILLTLAAVALLAIALPVFYNMLSYARHNLALERGLCSAEVVAVLNKSGYASVAVYNYGQRTCSAQYVLCLNAVGGLQTSGGAPLVYQAGAVIPPGALSLINTTLPYNRTLCQKYEVYFENGQKIIG